MDLDICPNPVFVIGSPRSGTTALALALGRHPGMWTAGESQVLVDLFFKGALDRNYAREGSGWLSRQGVGPEEFLADVGLGFNHLFTRAAGGKRWVDHTPRHTLMLEWLPAMFPGARFVHILRDGRRVVHSMVHFGEQRSDGEVPWWATDFTKACRTWVRFATAAVQHEAAQPARFLTVRNEDLVADPAGGFGRLLDFLGAAADPQPAEFFAGNRVNSSFAVAEQGLGAAQRTLTDPWAEWGDEERRTFARIAGPSLVAWGMARAEDVAPYGAG